MEIEAVLREVEPGSSAGFKEIALTGVHLGSYGRDLTPASQLVELPCALESAVPRRVRLQPWPVVPDQCLRAHGLFS